MASKFWQKAKALTTRAGKAEALYRKAAQAWGGRVQLEETIEDATELGLVTCRLLKAQTPEALKAFARSIALIEIRAEQARLIAPGMAKMVDLYRKSVLSGLRSTLSDERKAEGVKP